MTEFHSSSGADADLNKPADPTDLGNVPNDHHSTATVQLSVPADVSYLGVVRTLTASLAARCTLTLDEIEDLRIAVDEACALLMPRAAPGSALKAQFDVGLTQLRLSVQVATARSPADEGPDRTGFAWTVLEALADEVSTSSTDGALSIVLAKTSEAASSVLQTGDR